MSRDPEDGRVTNPVNFTNTSMLTAILSICLIPREEKAPGPYLRLKHKRSQV